MATVGNLGIKVRPNTQKYAAAMAIPNTPTSNASSRSKYSTKSTTASKRSGGSRS